MNSIADINKETILPDDICVEFDKMLKNQKLEHFNFLFLPDQIVNCDSVKGNRKLRQTGSKHSFRYVQSNIHSDGTSHVS